MNFFALSALFNLVTSIFFGFFVFFKNKDGPINRSYGLLSLSIAFWSGSYFIWQISQSYSEALLWVRMLSVGAIFIPACYLNFILCLLNRQNEKKWLILFSFTISLILAPLAFTHSFISGLKENFFFSYWPDPGFLYALFLIFFFACTLYAIYLMIMLLRTAGESEYHQRQIRYVLIASILGFLGGSTNYLPWYDIGVPPVLNFLVGVHVLILAYAVVKYQLMDIETVIHKTLAWLAASSFVFVPIVLLSYWLHPWYRQTTPLKVAFLCGGIFYFLTLYLKLAQPKIDHFFQRRKYDLEEASEKFISELVQLKGPAELIKKIQETINDTLYTEKISVFLYNESLKKFILVNRTLSEEITELPSEDSFLKWLFKKDELACKDFIEADPKYIPIRDQAQDYFKKLEAVVVIPLVLGERPLGFINLGRKANLKRYYDYDFHFLLILKNQSTIALSNSLLYGRVEEEVQLRTRQLVETQKQLVQAEKLATVGTLAGGVAHEINNPLTAILTNIQILLATSTNEEDKEALELVEEATKRCRSIVKKLMIYARKPLEKEKISEVNLSNVINNAVNFLGYQFRQEDIKIIAKLNHVAPVMAAQNELEQVVTNIVLNAKDAIKNIKKSGEIEIKLSQKDKMVIIEIKDDGIGIPEERLAKIFDPFFTTKDVGKGTGLGLSICQAIIEKYQGSISVESKLGKGAVFRIELPL